MKNNSTATFLVLAALACSGGVTNAGTSHNKASTVITTGTPVSVPATGLRQLSFNAPQFGRYSLSVNSDQGSALQLIDRENGPGEWHGVAGESNGRFDTFLEAGDYRLRVQSSERGSGEARIKLQAFEELHSEAVALVELKAENTTLGDYQQRSWWLQLDTPRRIVIEAGGRHLESLQLWRDGRWRVPIATEAEIVTPLPGQPLRRLSFSVQLEAGQYQLSAYGGAATTWAKTSSAAPLYLRWGVPALPAANRQQFQASPLGIDRYRVPDTADYFRLELPESAPATLAAGNWLANDPFRERSRSTISEESRLPVATLNLSSGAPIDQEARAKSRVITVRAAAGQQYTLQQFTRASHYPINQTGDWWIDSLHAGAPEDAIDATALLVAVHPKKNLRRIKATTAVEVDQRLGWRRRFNLLSTAELFLKIRENGDYAFTQLAGNDPAIADRQANLSLEPVYLSRPDNAPNPIQLKQGARETLSAGLYRLRFEPREKGIVELAIFGADNDIPSKSTIRGSNRFGVVALEPGWRHVVIPANQGGIDSGLIMRRLPLDMEQPLSITLAANERLSLPLLLPADGELIAVDEHGNVPKLSSRSSEGNGTLLESGGLTDVTLSNTGERSAVINLRWQNPNLKPDSQLHKAKPVQPTPLPRLSSNSPQFIDLAGGTSQTFELRVDSPAIYRIESTGLLATTGQLQTRVQPTLASATSNGIGRNFLIQRYLRSGNYRLSVGTEGASAGRLGVKLSAAPLINSGELATGITARKLLPEGKGLDQRFKVSSSGPYQLKLLSQLQQLSYRLEDSKGWPVVRPGSDSTLNLQLPADDYRLIIEPGSVSGRVVTRLSAIPQPAKFSGHGPHTATLNQSITHRWMEPDGKEPRRPDQWLFSLPAAATLNIKASNEMRGVLYKTDSGNAADKTVADVLSPSGWQGDLAAGNYRLELKHGRSSNRVDYQLMISSVQLLPGQTRSITAPASIALSLPDGLSRTASFGPSDVRARLYDSSESLIASNDDARDDWNFQIATSLPAGQYRLEVEPVSSRRAGTEISLQSPKTHLLANQRLQLNQLNEQTLDLQAQYTQTLQMTGSNEQLLLVRADANTSENGDIGMSLEQCMPGNSNGVSEDSAAQTCLPLAADSGQPAWLAIAPGSEHTADVSYRLRLWSQNDQANPHPVRLRLLQVEPELVSERQLAEGLQLPSARLVPGPLTIDDSDGWSVARLALSGAGVFTGATAGLRFASANDANIQGLQSTALPGQFLAAKQTWVASLTGARLQAQRQQLQSGNELSVPLRSGEQATLTVTATSHPTLVLARAHNGQPGIAANDSGGAANTGFSKGVAVTVLEANTTTPLRAWRADDDGPLALRVQRVALAPMQNVTADSQGQIVLPPHSAVNVALPPGRKMLRLALPAQTAAVLQDEITLWSGTASSSDSFESRARELHLYNAGAEPALFGLQHSIVGSTATAGELSESSPLWQQSISSRSRIHVRINNPAGTDRELGLGGNIESASWSGDDGRRVNWEAKKSLALKITGGGILSIDAQPGVLAAWLNGDDINDFSISEVTPINVPGTASVVGQNAFSFSTTEPQLLSIRGQAPALLRIQSNGQNHNAKLQPKGTRLDQYLPAGHHQLQIRLLNAKAIDNLTFNLRSIIEMTHVTTEHGVNENPATQAQPLRLAAGDSALYSFSINSDRHVGIGIKASPDQATARLMDSSGMLVGNGSTQLQALKAGRYLLQVSAPAGGESLEIMPQIIGLQDTGNGPPEKIRENYIEQARNSAEESR